MNFLKDGLSISEAKISAIIVGFLFSLGFGIYTFYNTGDISDNWLQLLEVMIVSISGINIVPTLFDKLKK